jgi:hypothetical protein
MHLRQGQKVKINQNDFLKSRPLITFEVFHVCFVVGYFSNVFQFIKVTRKLNILPKHQDMIIK